MRWKKRPCNWQAPHCCGIGKLVSGIKDALKPGPPVAAKDWKPTSDLVKQGEAYSIEFLHSDPDVRSAIEILIYGLKGMAAYSHHALILGKTDDEVSAFYHRALAATCDPNLGLMDFVGHWPWNAGSTI